MRGRRGSKVNRRTKRAGGGDQPQLTPREIEVLQQLALGRGVAEAAKSLGIAFETVRTHVRTGKRKLKENTAAGAVAEALRRGLIK